jgi:SAM-dependent methyltransferase
MKDFQLVQRLELLENECRDKKVLHLGCTNYPYTNEAIEGGLFLHFLLKEKCSELYGFDEDQGGLDILSQQGCTNLFQANLEDLESVPLDETFDVIIAGEIIEHLNNPGLFLNGIKRFMGPQTKLIITTVNAYCGFRFALYALNGKRGRNEQIHPDHVAYYSYSTLSVLLGRYDFKMENFLYYDIGKEHRPYSRWFVNLINDCFVKFTPQLADGVIAICRLSDFREGEGQE